MAGHRPHVRFSLPGDHCKQKKQTMASPQGATTELGLKDVKKKLDKALRAFDDQEQKILSQKSSLQAKISREMKSIIHIIEDRKKELLEQLDRLTQQKLQILNVHKQKVELTRTKMSNLILETSSQNSTSKEQEITVEFDPTAIQPQIEADMVFIRDQSEAIRQKCKSFGSIHSEQVAIDKCTLSGDGLKYAICKQQNIVTMTNVDSKLQIEAKLVNVKKGDSIKCNIQRDNTRYTISYSPVNRGKHTLHVKLNDRHVQGSPYTIAVAPPTDALSQPVRIIEGVSKPRGVVTNSRIELIVAEYKSNYVSIISEDGRKKSFGGFGEEDGKFNKPRGIAVDKDDNIYVSDSGNHRIQKFSPEGRFIAAVGCLGTGNAQFNLPLGICFNKSKDRLYVCDQANYRVQVFAANLTFRRCFGSEGDKEGQFNFPENIAVDDAGILYVSDYYNNRVQLFTHEGQFVRAISQKSKSSIANGFSSDCDTLVHPRALAVDGGGVVYVSEWECDGVCVFSPQGEFVELLGNKGCERVCGLSVDSDNTCTIIVCRHCKIQLF